MRFVRVLAAACFVISASTVRADLFLLTYSGASFGNTAEATGTIDMDPSQILPVDYTDDSGFFFPQTKFVSSLSITITGASSGNGTYTLADFDTVLFWMEGGNFDFTTELVGQPTTGDPFGTPSSDGGDFNLFNLTAPGQADAPLGTWYFTLTTDAGLEDSMLLTSFRPLAVPEPGSVALLGCFGVVGAGSAFRKLRRRRLSA